MFYATLDAEEGRISPNAAIFAFETELEARAYLLSGYDKADWKHDTAKIESGRWGDYWIKLHSKPDLSAKYFSPFSPDQLCVSAPGQHSWDQAWWIEPIAPVLIVERITELDFED